MWKDTPAKRRCVWKWVRNKLLRKNRYKILRFQLRILAFTCKRVRACKKCVRNSDRKHRTRATEPTIVCSPVFFQSNLSLPDLIVDLIFLRKKSIPIDEFSFEIDSERGDDPCNRKFSARICGVPQALCGLLWSEADDAARVSKVDAVRLEQQRIDEAAEDLSEEEIALEVAQCRAIPTIRIRPIGMSQDLERLTFQKLCGFVRPQTVQSPPLLRAGADADLKEEQGQDEEDLEVLYADDGEVVMSQKTTWSL